MEKPRLPSVEDTKISQTLQILHLAEVYKVVEVLERESAGQGTGERKGKPPGDFIPTLISSRFPLTPLFIIQELDIDIHF